MDRWNSADKAHTAERGLSGELGRLEGAERWTKSDVTCLSIGDMGDEMDLDINDERPLEAEADEDLLGGVQVNAGQIGGLDNAE